MASKKPSKTSKSGRVVSSLPVRQHTQRYQGVNVQITQVSPHETDVNIWSGNIAGRGQRKYIGLMIYVFPHAQGRDPTSVIVRPPGDLYDAESCRRAARLMEVAADWIDAHMVGEKLSKD